MTLGRGWIMKTHKVKVVVLEDGKIVIDDLPVVKGDEVEVAIQILDPIPVTYPLHGAPFRTRSFRTRRRSIGVGCLEVILLASRGR